MFNLCHLHVALFTNQGQLCLQTTNQHVTLRSCSLPAHVQLGNDEGLQRCVRTLPRQLQSSCLFAWGMHWQLQGGFARSSHQHRSELACPRQTKRNPEDGGLSLMTKGFLSSTVSGAPLLMPMGLPTSSAKRSSARTFHSPAAPPCNRKDNAMLAICLLARGSRVGCFNTFEWTLQTRANTFVGQMFLCFVQVWGFNACDMDSPFRKNIFRHIFALPCLLRPLPWCLQSLAGTWSLLLRVDHPLADPKLALLDYLVLGLGQTRRMRPWYPKGCRQAWIFQIQDLQSKSDECLMRRGRY